MNTADSESIYDPNHLSQSFVLGRNEPRYPTKAEDFIIGGDVIDQTAAKAMNHFLRESKPKKSGTIQVWIKGKKAVADYRKKRIDPARLLAMAKQAKRSGISVKDLIMGASNGQIP